MIGSKLEIMRKEDMIHTLNIARNLTEILEA